MTQVAQIFEEEKQQALLQVTQIFEEEKRKTIQDIATKMIEKGYTTEEIAAVIPSYSQNDLEMLRKEIAGNQL